MKLQTYLVALTPPVFVLAVLTFFNPTWINEFSVLQCLAIGAAVGLMAAVVALMWESARHEFSDE